MIKENKVWINVNYRNFKIYKNLGYDIDIKMGQSLLLEVPVDQVSKNSKIKITAICDICRKETNIIISKYWKNFDRGGYNFYSCFGCKNKKKEMTNMKRYGVKSFSSTDEFIEKFKDTSMKKYGVDNPNKLKVVRDKIKKTNLEKYGFVSHLNTEKQVSINKEWMSSDEFKSKSKTALLEKYGEEYFSKTEQFRNTISNNKDKILNKIRETFTEKYGVDWYSKTSQFKEKQLLIIEEKESKRKSTCIEKYGVDNVFKVKLIYDKGYEKKVENGQIIPDSILPEWIVYKRKVRKITNRFKSNLYENWDGYDYYDGEYIMGNLSFGSSHGKFPSIDHKISTIFGFLNNTPVDEIGDISNLCITKRQINSQKGSLIEEAFLQKIDFSKLKN